MRVRGAVGILHCEFRVVPERGHRGRGCYKPTTERCPECRRPICASHRDEHARLRHSGEPSAQPTGKERP